MDATNKGIFANRTLIIQGTPDLHLGESGWHDCATDADLRASRFFRLRVP